MTDPATSPVSGAERRISTGVPGLDNVLCGGLTQLIQAGFERAPRWAKTGV